MAAWDRLPNELIQRIAKVAAAYLYNRNGRWVGHSLALVNRTFAACVRPVVLGEIVLRRDASAGFHAWMNSIQRDYCTKLTHALVVRAHTDRSHFDSLGNDRLASTFCHITFVAVPFLMFCVLASHDEFRPRTVFLDHTFMDRSLAGRSFDRAFRCTTHLYSVTSTKQFPRALPALTHVVLGLCCFITLPQLLDKDRCPHLQRLLACMPSRYDMSPSLRAFMDDRIWVMQTEPWDTAAAIDALNGRDVWGEGERLSTFVAAQVEYQSPLLQYG